MFFFGDLHYYVLSPIPPQTVAALMFSSWDMLITLGDMVSSFVSSSIKREMLTASRKLPQIEHVWTCVFLLPTRAQ